MDGFPGITHVAVTVSDLDRSRQFYDRLFDSVPVLDEDTGTFHHSVYAIGGGALFGLHTHPKTNDQPTFSEFRSGLDHVSFGVADRTELEEWASRLDELGIAHGAIVDAHYGSGLSFRDPDNIALELSPRRPRSEDAASRVLRRRATPRRARPGRLGGHGRRHLVS